MNERQKEILLTKINQVGYYRTAKLLGITMTKLAKLTGGIINHESAHEIIIENINSKNLPTKYKEFKISTNFDGVVYWEGKFYGDRFLPTIKETIWIMATPFWDGYKTTPVETEWYSLVNTSNDTLMAETDPGGDYFKELKGVDYFDNVDELFNWYNEVYLPGVYNIVMNKFLPLLRQDMDDRLGNSVRYSPIRESIVRVLREETIKKYLRPSEEIKKVILTRLNNIFSDLNMYHIESYKTRHDFEFCKNGKKMMNLTLFFEETDDRRPTSERKFMESFLSIPKSFVSNILKSIPIRQNYLLYLIEEWFEDNFFDNVINEMGRDDISIDELSFTDRVDVCVPPVTEKPEGVTQDDMIEFIMKGTLFKRNDLLRREDEEPGYIEDLYLDKLRNLEMDKLTGNNPMEEGEIKEEELTEKCWKGYTQKGMKTMFGKRYPNCVKKTKK